MTTLNIFIRHKQASTHNKLTLDNKKLKMNIWWLVSILWYAFLQFSISFAISSNSLFIRSVFENGISVNNLTSPTIRGCLANCRSTCSAVTYNPTTSECRLFTHVLLKWPVQAIVDVEERMYVKVSCFNQCLVLLRSHGMQKSQNGFE